MTVLSDSLEFAARVSGKKCIVFGAGPSAQSMIVQFRYPVAYFVDNDESKWGKTFQGRIVASPDELAQEDLDGVVVVIASTAVEEITVQLERMGLISGLNFLVSPLIAGQMGEKNTIHPKLLVSCFEVDGGLYLVDINSGDKKFLLEGNLRGMQPHGDTIVVVDEHKGLIRLDTDFIEIQRCEMPDSVNMHGITFNPDENVFYVNETGRDRIGIYDAETLNRINEINLGRESNPAFEQHHINDVLYENGRLFVSMFSRQGVWRKNIWSDGCLASVDIKANKLDQILLGGLKQPHSILNDGGGMWICNSMDCSVWFGDQIMCQTNGYVRGLAKHQHYLYIGQSTMRRLDRFANRFNNISLDCGILVWNIDNKTSRFVSLPAKSVFDILVLETD